MSSSLVLLKKNFKPAESQSPLFVCWSLHRQEKKKEGRKKAISPSSARPVFRFDRAGYTPFMIQSQLGTLASYTSHSACL
ncbi:hypothetical protein TNCV_1955391 [Trichonephila clavipes]|nr:hypothetical protein TNCV_1955391 [Trichonephila clavipes]